MLLSNRLTCLVVEELEPLILHSADVNPLLTGIAPLNDSSHAQFTTTSTSQIQNTNLSSNYQNTQRQEVVFIDSSVQGYEQLASEIVSQQNENRVFHVVILDSNKNGVEQITAALNVYKNLDAIHIISHGEAGEILIGDTKLGNQNLLDNAVSISQWGGALNASGDILLYGCDVAEGSQGEEFVNQLGQLTGADVAASRNLTGSNKLNGDWVLEYSVGRVDSTLALTQSYMLEYDGVLATYTVTNANASGAGSLRAAINSANSNGGTDTILFNIPGLGVKTILPTNTLNITDTVIIDATSQPGYSSSTPLIELNGASAGVGKDGLYLTSGASGSTIKGLIINGYDGNGIILDNASNVVIQGNYIGVNSAGTAGLANNDNGIFLFNSANNNTIGGTTAAQRNIISGNVNNGILISGSDGNNIWGNYLGVNTTGLSSIGNGLNGISLTNTSSSNYIGGSAAGERNIISGNSLAGVDIDNANNNYVEGNYIGVNVNGTAGLSNAVNGIWIGNGSSTNVVGGTAVGERNVISGNLFSGISLSGATDTSIEGNYIGVDATGNTALANADYGIWIGDNSSDNTIGDTSVGARNIISGNGLGGINISTSSGDTIVGNYIGTNAAGTAAISNQFGIVLYQANNAVIGGNTASARNVISGNTNDGINISDTTGLTIQGNFIGTTADGATPLANDAHGIFIYQNTSNNLIGGTSAGEGNLIAYNHFSGISMGATSNTGNEISGNSIYANWIIGIDLNNNGVTYNDAGDADTGANNLQNFATVTGAFINGGNITIVGALNSIAGGFYRVEFFASANADPTGFGEGERYLGFASVLTDGSGNTSFETTLAAAVTAGEYISVTVTRLSTGDTSEFSQVLKASNWSGTVGTQFIVTNTNDSGAGSLQQAILDANANAGLDTIIFNIGSGQKLISPPGSLPNITEAVVIDARTQPGYTNVPLIEIRGLGAGLSVNGLELNATVTTGAIRGLDIDGYNGYGISIDGASNFNIEGNYIGVEILGVTPIGNSAGGILVTNGATNIVIGGTTWAERNIISGNSTGIFLASSGNYVQGNYIGTDRTGTSGVGNSQNGIVVSANNNTIGGSVSGAGNIISSNQSHGIEIGASNTIVQGNYIGLDVTGNVDLGNNSVGILVTAGSNNTIGGTTAASRNVISGNDNGIELDSGNNTVQGNYIGTNAAGNAAIANNNYGIIIITGADNNTIGGTSAGAGNVISGNGLNGVLINGADGTALYRNYVGVSANGATEIGNLQHGVALVQSTNTRIGDSSGHGNVISSNSNNGIYIYQSTDTIVEGNLIGLNAAGNTAFGNGENGIIIENNSSNNTIGGTSAGARNVIADSGRDGITIIDNSTNNTVQGNYIGLDATGTLDFGNSWNGVFLQSESNVIGGSAAGAGNVISGNTQNGIRIENDDNTIQGNLIGLNAAGTSAIGNSWTGVAITGADNTIIGGTTSSSRNVISASGRQGILIDGGSANTTLFGNYIGTNAAGTSALANNWSGIEINNSSNNTIGGVNAGEGNLISGNNERGILISSTSAITVQGNYIGTNAAGTGAVANNWAGIQVDNSTNVTVGGTSAGARNIISGNNEKGVFIINGGSNTVQGNYIGTNVTGNAMVSNGQSGVQIADSSNNLIGGTTAAARNIISGNNERGININGTSSTNTITGNYIGVDVTGSSVIRNLFAGVEIGDGSNNTIGGTAAGAGNVISGNSQRGIFINHSTGNIVQGNYVGTDATGMVDLGNNEVGIEIDNGTNNTIGGTLAAARNVIAGNNEHGIRVTNSINTIIQGNYIGTNKDGNAALGNSQAGIFVRDASSGTVIGGSAAGAGNTIAGNSSDGINIRESSGTLIRGNYIGTNASDTNLGNGRNGVYFDEGATGTVVGGTSAGEGNIIAYSAANGIGSANNLVSGNRVLGNSIYSNTGLGIDFGGDGVTANDSGDGDATGNTNGLQNFPVISTAYVTGANILITGLLNSHASRSYRIEFFANNSKDSSDHGEGKVYIGYIDVTTDASGDATFRFTGTGATVGQWISATATDSVTNETSEFALDQQALANAAPVITSNGGGISASISIYENTSAVTTVTATDSDADSPAFTINGGADSAKFSINASTGVLTFNTAPNYDVPTDANLDNVYIVDILVSDGKGGTDIQTIQVTVNNVNEAPSGADNTVTTLEDNAYTFTATDFGFSDSSDNPANSFLSVRITTLPSVGTLTNNGVTLSAGDFVTKADIDLGRLVFTPIANANGNAYASFTFQVRDNGGTSNGGVDLDATPNTMTINVTSVNDAPSGTNKTVTTVEDTAYTFTVSDFGFSDMDGNSLQGVKITTIPGTGTLTLSGVAVTAGQTITAANITAGNLRFTPATDGNGTSYASFTFQVQDDGGTANGGVDLDGSANTITINVTSVNDAPSGTDKTVTTSEDTAYTFSVSDFGFSDVDGNSLQAVKITTIPGAGTLTLSGVAVTAGQTITAANITAGNLRFTPAANANGASYASFTFQVQDDGGTANGGVDLDGSANTITVNVTNVNDAPSGTDKTVTTSEDTAYTFTVSDFGFSDVDGNSLQAVKITTIPGAGTLTLSGVAVTAGQTITAANITAGNLRFTPAANANGASYASFTFQVQDDGGTANGGVDLDGSANTITVNVTSINDAPSGTDKTVTTSEDTAYTFTVSDFGFSDVDGNSLQAVKITTIPGAGTLTLSGVAVTAGQTITAANITAGNLRFTPATDGNGTSYASFTFQLQDDGGTANGGVDLDGSANTITVNVTSVNDAPAGTDNTITFAQNGSYTLTASDFGFSDTNDSPANSFLAVKITNILGSGVLTNNGVAVSDGDTITVSDINLNRLVFTPTVGYSGSSYASFTFQVQDNGGTSNGGINLDASANLMTFNVTPSDSTATISYIVTNTNDSGAGSLRNAIINANTTTGSDNIIFNIGSGAKTITLSSALPTITGTVNIDTTTQPGYAGIPLITLNGASAGASTSGFYISSGGSNSVIKGLVITGFSDSGITINGATGITIQSNYIGINAAGTAAANTNNGITLLSSNNNIIGGTTASLRNIISGNTSNGIEISNSSGNIIQGNYLGTNVTGTTEVTNGGDGIYVIGTSSNNIIGGTALGATNVISGNTITGIEIAGGTNNSVLGNYIGLTSSGLAMLGNHQDGINISSNSNIIGGITAGSANYIGGNSGSGIELAGGSSNTIQGNYIGVGADGVTTVGGTHDGIKLTSSASNNLIGGTSAGAGNTIKNNSGIGVFVASSGSTGNQILGNSIASNSNLGIDLNPSGVLANDSGDADTGANGKQNYPVISSVAPSGSNVVITGTLNSLASSNFRIEFFANASNDPSNYGEGERYLGYVQVTTDSSGNVSFNVTLSSSVSAGEWISATATDLTANNTSEFALSFQVPVNVAPAGTNNTVATLEDTAYTFTAADFGFADSGNSPANNFLAVKITTVPSAGALTNNGVAVSAGDFVTKADIDLGRLIFTPAANANGSTYASFTFQVRDDGGTSNGGVDLDASPNTMTINVTSVNDAPSGTDKTVTTSEDTAYTFTVSDFGFSDVDGNSLQAVKITTIPGAGTLTLSGVAVTAGQTITAANITAGNLRFTPAANANGASYASFTFQVQDDGGTANGGVDLDGSANTITVNVTSVNDAPSGTDKTVTTSEDTAYTFTVSDFGFSDVDGNSLQAVKITTIPGTGTLTLSGVAVTAGQTITAANITAGNLRFIPAANANGVSYASFTFQVQDDGGTANGGVDLDGSANTITVNVTSVNDAPSGTDKTVTTLQDTAYTFTVSDFGFSDVDGNSLQAVKITTIPGAGTLTLSGVAVTAGQTISVANIAAGNLKFTPALGVNGVSYASFTFQVQDDGGTANSGVDLDGSANTITVNVTAVNSAPSGTDKTVTTLEDTAYTFTISDFGFSDVDGNSLQAVKITTIPGAGILTLSGVAVTAGQTITAANITAGNLRLTPAADGNGTSYASFTFQVQDDGGTANGGVDLDGSANTITVNVTSINDAPSGTNNTVTTNEDTAYTFAAADFGFSDSDGNSLQAVKITTIPGAGTLTLSGVAVTAGQTISVANINAGNLRFTPAANANGTSYASFTFQVQDNGGTLNGGVDTDPTARTMTVNVTSVNDAPSGTNNTVTTNEDTAYTFAASDFGFSDSDGNSLQAVKITTIPGAGTLTLSGVAVTAGQTISVANINAGNLRFTPAANANGAGYANFTFQVQDNGGTSNGGVDTDPTARTMTVNVTSVNDAPIITVGNAVLTGITEDDTTWTGVAVSSITNTGVTDVDISALKGIAIIGVTPSAQWQYSTDGGTSWSNVGTVSGNNALLLRDTDLIRLAPDGLHGDDQTFTYRAWDQTTGIAGTKVDASSNGGTTAFSTQTRTYEIVITSINDAPAGTNKTVTTLEDNAYIFTAADFGFGDTDSNTFLSVKITTLASAGSLTNNGVAVTAGSFVLKSDIDSGLLVFTPAVNGNGAGYASFTFQVRDNGGTSNGGVDIDPTARTMTVNVTSVNDAPSGTNNTVTTNEDTAYTFAAADFGFSDSDGNSLQAVKITTIPGAGTLTLSGVAVTAGQTISVANINAGNLRFTPAANANGTSYASFTFQVQDNGGTLNGGVDTDPTARTMTVNVTSVNDAPSGTNNTVTTNEDTAYTFAASDFGFSDSDGNSLQAVKITTIPGAGTLTLSGVAVTAGQTISVANINAGNLRFTPAANANGAGYANFTFQVQDNGGTSNGGVDTDPTARMMTVNVTSVNDAPNGTDKTVTTLEDAAYTFTASNFGFSDSDGNTFLSVRITTIPGAGTLTNNGVAINAGDYVTKADIDLGKLVFTPAANANGNTYASFTFQVRDNGGSINGGIDLDNTPNTMTVNVTSVNDAPAGSDNAITILRGNAYIFSASDFGFTDTDGNSLLSVKITNLPTAGLLTNNGVAMAVGSFISKSDIDLGRLVFTPGSNANGNNYGNFTFQVRDNGGTGNGGVDLDTTPNTFVINVNSPVTIVDNPNQGTSGSNNNNTDNNSTTSPSTGSSTTPSSSSPSSSTSKTDKDSQSKSDKSTQTNTGASSIVRILGGDVTFINQNSINTYIIPSEQKNDFQYEKFTAQTISFSNRLGSEQNVIHINAINMDLLGKLGGSGSNTPSSLILRSLETSRSALQDAFKGSENESGKESHLISVQNGEKMVALFSLGAVWVVAQKASLLAGLSVTFPAWRRLDPYPVLTDYDREKEDKKQDEEEDKADKMFR